MNAVVEDVEYVPTDAVDPLPTFEPKAHRLKPVLPAVTGTQKRKINRIVGRAVALELLASAANSTLPIDLMPVDRIQQRWAVSVGSALPSDTWDDSPIAKPPPLDEDIAILVDQINLRAPYRQQRVLRAWYKSGVSSSVIADTIGVDRGGLYVEWRAALTWLKYQFMATSHAGLRELLNNFA